MVDNDNIALPDVEVHLRVRFEDSDPRNRVRLQWNDEQGFKSLDIEPSSTSDGVSVWTDHVGSVRVTMNADQQLQTPTLIASTREWTGVLPIFADAAAHERLGDSTGEEMRNGRNNANGNGNPGMLAPGTSTEDADSAAQATHELMTAIPPTHAGAMPALRRRRDGETVRRRRHGAVPPQESSAGRLQRAADYEAGGAREHQQRELLLENSETKWWSLRLRDSVTQEKTPLAFSVHQTWTEHHEAVERRRREIMMDQRRRAMRRRMRRWLSVPSWVPGADYVNEGLE